MQAFQGFGILFSQFRKREQVLHDMRSIHALSNTLDGLGGVGYLPGGKSKRGQQFLTQGFRFGQLLIPFPRRLPIQLCAALNMLRFPCLLARHFPLYSDNRANMNGAVMKFLCVLLAASFAWSQDLTPDLRWSSLQFLDIYAVSFSPKNELYAFGQFPTSTRTSPFYSVAKWTKRGWEFLPKNPWRTVNALAFDKNGTLFAAGQFDSTTYGLASWNGAEWHRVELDSAGWVTDLESDKEGNIYATGRFMSIDGKSMTAIGKWDGVAWTSMKWPTSLRMETNQLVIDPKTGAVYFNIESGSGGINRWTEATGFKYLGNFWNVYDMSVSPEGKLFAIGTEMLTGGHVSVLCKIFSDAGATTVRGFHEDDNPSAIHADSNGSFLATGHLLRTYNSDVANVYWDGDSLHPYALASDWGARWSGSVEKFVTSPSGDVFGFGHQNLFQLKGNKVIPFGGPSVLDRMFLGENGVAYSWSRGEVVAWDGFTRKRVANSPVGDMIQIELGKNGEFFVLSDSAYAKKFIHQWNGKEWIALPSRSGSIYSIAVDRSGIPHYSDASRAYRWTDAGWVALPGNLYGVSKEYRIVFDNENRIYRISGSVHLGNDTGWVKAPFLAGDTTIARVYDLWFDRDNHAYIVGRGDHLRMKIWKWDGQALTVIGEFLSGWINDLDVNWVKAHAFDSKGNLYVGGNFHSVVSESTTVYAADFVKWDGKSWSKVGKGLWDMSFSEVTDIAVDADDYVFLAGSFEVAGNKYSFRYAIYDGSDRPMPAGLRTRAAKLEPRVMKRFTRHGIHLLKTDGTNPSIHLLDGRRVSVPR